MTGRERFDPISLEIMWSRLIGIADDMWTTVLRTAVSTIIGAAQDFGCEVLDASGASVAHSNRSMPSFNVIMPGVVRATIDTFPTRQMRPGDVYVTNDPWICAGHLDDIATIMPVFRGERLVGFTATIAHSSSIGGSLSNRTARDIYEEGLRIPVSQLYSGGAPNAPVFDFIANNVRTPQMVLTDIEAQVTANNLGATRMVAFLDEYELDDFSELAAVIQTQSESAMRAALADVRDGVYESEVWADGLESPVRLQCRVTICGDRLHVDFAGTSPQQARGGINCTLSYTRAHAVYPLKCLFSPAVPANEGTYRPLSVTAPAGSILNCEQPASVRSRPRTGWHIHTALFKALHPVLPDRVQAANGLMQVFNVYGEEGNGRYYNAHFLLSGGRGASQGRDGIGRNAFPSSARNVAVEELELRAPVVVHQRGLRRDSGGDGQWRGAAGHHFVVGKHPGHAGPLTLYIDPDRMRYPANGLAGGDDAPLTAMLRNGEPLTLGDVASGQVTLESASDLVEFKLPGGGGYGPPAARDPALSDADARRGLWSPSSPES